MKLAHWILITIPLEQPVLFLPPFFRLLLPSDKPGVNAGNKLPCPKELVLVVNKLA